MSKYLFITFSLSLLVILSGCVSPGHAPSSAAPAASAASESTPSDSPDLQPAPTAEAEPIPQPEPDLPPAPVPVDPSGIPLADLMPPTPGLRLVYQLVQPDPDTTPPDALSYPQTFALVVQPSRDASANLAVHTVDGTQPQFDTYLLMDQDETTWFPRSAAPAGFFAFPWPRFLPHDGTSFSLNHSGFEGTVEPSGEGEWMLTNRAETTGSQVVLAVIAAEPSDLETLAPVSFQLTTDATQLTWQLQAAAVYRERTVSGVVVSPLGRPQKGVTVALHPAVGALPAEHRTVTGTFGTFELSYRAAPGDGIRLYYGVAQGKGADAVIPDPAVISGRVGSPDFATLIFPAP
ncbi:MAG: hypothetical protein WCY01_10195 [Alkalispirochaeta sp.]